MFTKVNTRCPSHIYNSTYRSIVDLISPNIGLLLATSFYFFFFYLSTFVLLRFAFLLQHECCPHGRSNTYFFFRLFVVQIPNRTINFCLLSHQFSFGERDRIHTPVFYFLLQSLHFIAWFFA